MPETLDDEIKLILEQTDSNLSELEKNINTNYYAQIILLLTTILHTFFPLFDKSVKEYFNVDLKILEFIIPFYFTFLLIKFGSLLIYYLQQRQIQLKAIKSISTQTAWFNRSVLDKLYRKQTIFEYWHRILFLREHPFNKAFLLLLTAFSLLILILNQSFSLVYLIKLNLNNWQYFILAIYLISFLILFYTFYKAMNKSKIIRAFLILSVVFTIITSILILLRVGIQIPN